MRPTALLHSLLLALALAASAPVVAQDAPAGFDPRTGDAWVDTWLADVNRYGGTYREPFVDELVRYHGAPRELVLELLRRPGWTPGDVYFACGLASVLGRPCRYVVDEYERERGAGWGALAKRLGIEPGSAEFHRLKRGFVPTYDRWSRPLRLDEDLERAFPDRVRRVPGPATDARGRSGAEAPQGPEKSAVPPKGDRPAPRSDAGKGGIKPERGHGRPSAKGEAKGKGGKGGKGKD